MNEGWEKKLLAGNIGLTISGFQEEQTAIQWITDNLPQNFDFNANITGCTLINRACKKSKPKIAKWLLERGAVVDLETLEWAKNNSHLSSSQVILDTPLEKTIGKLVSCGLTSPVETPFTQFLYKGVYDPRLLIHVADFAFAEDSTHKRKFT